MTRFFILNGYRYDFVSHFRRLAVGTVEEGFVVDVYTEEGQPFNWYPNQIPHPHIDRPQRQVVFWAGQEVLPVTAPFNPVNNSQITEDEAFRRIRLGQPIEYRQVSTKRGADWRTRLFPTLQYLVKKHEIAALLGKNIGEVTSNEARQMRAHVADPVDLRALSIDDAVREVWGDEPRNVTQRPRGSVANIDAAYDATVNAGGTKVATGTVLNIIEANNTARTYAAWRWGLSSLPAAGTFTLNDLDWQFNVITAVADTDPTYVGVYGTGLAYEASPDADTGSTFTGRVDNYPTNVPNDNSSNTFFGSTGSKTDDIGTRGETALLNARAGDNFGLGIFTDGNTNPAVAASTIEAVENAGTDPATLIVDYTETSFHSYGRPYGARGQNQMQQLLSFYRRINLDRSPLWAFARYSPQKSSTLARARSLQRFGQPLLVL